MLVLYYFFCWGGINGYRLLTSGLGAVGVFWLTNKLITKISYDSEALFILGAMSFVVMLILFLINDMSLTLGKYGICGSFAIVYFTWQSLIGYQLVKHLSSAEGKI